ncbi:translation initiation protein-like protein Sua5 [Amylocarpus encephaloides]|uniref:Threonylcarbamoyl-AMP synthase n=1 Tax=Amylocarpus encephaloides TaxID=45428 RepID=A0A9P7YPY5_9HELO|nr:translation initiation protein-like protein Sua5 [Amylocarpus encephaloides]
MGSNQTNEGSIETLVLPVDTAHMGAFQDPLTLENWELPISLSGLKPLQEAAAYLKTSSIPVGFPTETVYGLGADATRSDAVKGIYKAKGRPSDNPLIIHVCDLEMLRNFLRPKGELNGNVEYSNDPIPEIYMSLIQKFWPGPLTILLPNPTPSKLAPEVTAGLKTFGARMPESPLALSLIKLAGVPLAAPSANASTKPSPTTAEHVRHDLDGKIELILDGGACQVGVESTVVDGLCDPPVLLRPGGLSIDRIRESKGWENVVKGYKDQSELGSKAPRAPGMKYKHYSPKAKVVLFEATHYKDPSTGLPPKTLESLRNRTTRSVPSIGIVSTRNWSNWAGFDSDISHMNTATRKLVLEGTSCSLEFGDLTNGRSEKVATLISISLGSDTKDIAHALFAALRELDKKNVDTIYVEGIEDQGDIAAAVMNRLRKAASVIEN